MILNNNINRQSRKTQMKVDTDSINKVIESSNGTIKLINSEFANSIINKYKFEVKIRLITGFDNYQIPIISNFFNFEIFLPLGYPDKRSPICTIKPLPIHPFVQLKPTLFNLLYKPTGKWVDPRNYIDNDLGVFLVRVLNSLSYKDVEKNPSVIANKDAFYWYQEWQNFLSNSYGNNIFPTDSINLPILNTEHFSKYNNNQLHTGLDGKNDSKPNFQVDSLKSFNIIETKPGYEPEFGTKPNFEYRKSLKSITNDIDNFLLIQLSAFEKIKKHIGWGIKTNNNQVEQGGILLGRVIRDRYGRIYGIVEEAIPGITAIGSSAYLEMNFETWQTMIEKADAFIENNPHNKIHIIGWYHTHPNNLDVFMSITDKKTQKHVFPQEWQFAVVLNPHKMIWGAYCGNQSEECQGFIGSYSNNTSQTNIY